MSHKARTKLFNTRDYVVIDLETTGLSPTWDSIIEVGALRVRDGEVVDSFQSLSDPGYDEEEWDDFITDLTGITFDMVQGKPSNDQVIQQLMQFIESDAVLGHNVCFDLAFLDFDPEIIIDTRRISQHVLSCGQSLDAVYSACCDIDEDLDELDHHRSIADCMRTYRSYETMRPMLVEKYGEDPEEGYRKLARNRSNQNAVKASDFTATIEEIDESNPFYDCRICFTGKLEGMTRAEAFQHAANLGAVPQDNVTKKTDYLVLGSTDYCASLNGAKSSKQKKAEKLQQDGHHILILDDKTFSDVAGTID